MAALDLKLSEPARSITADYAERYADSLYLHAIRPRPLGQARADGIACGRDLCEAARHGLDARIVEAQPIAQCGR
jgi:hypothetical protein